MLSFGQPEPLSQITLSHIKKIQKIGTFLVEKGQIIVGEIDWTSLPKMKAGYIPCVWRG